MSLSKIAKVTRGGGDLPEPHRRLAARPVARALDRDPGRPAGLGHRHAAGRVRRLAGRGGAGGRGACASPPAGARAARRPSATRDSQALFGIQQGSTFEALRRESSERLIEIGFDGYAIGGLAVGEGHEAMCEVLDYAPAMLPADRPRYLMGVGKPIDLVEAVARGRRHVRLRAAHPLRPPRPGLDLGRSGQSEERPLRRGRSAAGSGDRLPGQPRLLARPICITWSSRERSSARCCSPGTTSPSSTR